MTTNTQSSEVLSGFTTLDLVNELKQREGVQEILVKPHDGYTILANLNTIENIGPARIFIVID